MSYCLFFYQIDHGSAFRTISNTDFTISDVTNFLHSESAGPPSLLENARVPAMERVPVPEDDPALESEALPSFWQAGCNAYSDGWCRADLRNSFTDLDILDCCPLDPQRIGKPRYRIVSDDGSQTNAAFFGCAICPSRKTIDGLESCSFDPALLRWISPWGFCLRHNEDGPVQGWRAGFTMKYSGSVDQEEENS